MKGNAYNIAMVQKVTLYRSGRQVWLRISGVFIQL